MKIKDDKKEQILKSIVPKLQKTRCWRINECCAMVLTNCEGDYSGVSEKVYTINTGHIQKKKNLFVNFLIGQISRGRPATFNVEIFSRMRETWQLCEKTDQTERYWGQRPPKNEKRFQRRL